MVLPESSWAVITAIVVMQLESSETLLPSATETAATLVEACSE